MRKSFTLIELLIVIVIVGVLATLAVPAYQRMIERSKSAEAKYFLSAIADSIWRYHLESGKWPFVSSSVDFSSLDMKIGLLNSSASMVRMVSGKYYTCYLNTTYGGNNGDAWGFEITAQSNERAGGRALGPYPYSEYLVCFYFVSETSKAFIGQFGNSIQKMDDNWVKIYKRYVYYALGQRNAYYDWND